MSSKKVLVTGANGQLGMEFRELVKSYPGIEFTFLGKEQLQIENRAALNDLFLSDAFSFCINCAAYTAVDKAESEISEAFKINAIAPGFLAEACSKFDVKLIHFSTDYVFDGTNLVGYRESDETNPINVYGTSKLQGEINIQNTFRDFMIIRTSWVFSHFQKNFVKTMIALMNEKASLNIVNDQYGCPTYARDLAIAVTEIISTGNFVSGIYHYCNQGATTWYNFAVEIKKLIRSNTTLHPVDTNAFPTIAKRPRNSVLETAKFRDTFGMIIPSWQQSLQDCISLVHLPPANK